MCTKYLESPQKHSDKYNTVRARSQNMFNTLMLLTFLINFQNYGLASLKVKTGKQTWAFDC